MRSTRTSSPNGYACAAVQVPAARSQLTVVVLGNLSTQHAPGQEASVEKSASRTTQPTGREWTIGRSTRIPAETGECGMSVFKVRRWYHGRTSPASG
ncbi:MAG: hypothetical protein HY904_09245 [Deltaproteobacteria bacterium]|nr:hypothetical protein [Deltaproteobacteria bacterium]